MIRKSLFTQLDLRRELLAKENTIIVVQNNTIVDGTSLPTSGDVGVPVESSQGVSPGLGKWIRIRSLIPIPHSNPKLALVIRRDIGLGKLVGKTSFSNVRGSLPQANYTTNPPKSTDTYSPSGFEAVPIQQA